MRYFKLNDGNQIPANGFGTFQIPNNNQCVKAVANAIRVGYRLIDTAEIYGNEKAVGQGIKQSGINRDQIFVTSKLDTAHIGYTKTKGAIDESLERLQLDYLDLFLIHMPFRDSYGSWRAMEEAQKTGKIKSIGVSNFNSVKITDLAMFNDVKPAINQIENNPFNQRTKEVKYLKSIGIQPEAWLPFAEGLWNIFKNPILNQIAQKHHKSVAQVVLRWQYQRGIVTLAKSVHLNRVKENFAIYDFDLDQKDMKAISKLNENKSLAYGMKGDPQSHNPQTIKRLISIVKK